MPGEKIVTTVGDRSAPAAVSYRAAAFRDLVLLSWAASPRGPAMRWRMLLSIADGWERPRFPSPATRQWKPA